MAIIGVFGKSKGFTMLPNNILDILMQIDVDPDIQRVLNFLWRHAYGYRKNEVTAKLSYISEKTGLSSELVLQIMNLLQRNNVICYKLPGGFSGSEQYLIILNENFEEWNKHNLNTIPY